MFATSRHGVSYCSTAIMSYNKNSTWRESGDALLLCLIVVILMEHSMQQLYSFLVSRKLLSCSDIQLWTELRVSNVNNSCFYQTVFALPSCFPLFQYIKISATSVAIRRYFFLKFIFDWVREFHLLSPTAHGFASEWGSIHAHGKWACRRLSVLICRNQPFAGIEVSCRNRRVQSRLSPIGHDA